MPVGQVVGVTEHIAGSEFVEPPLDGALWPSDSLWPSEAVWASSSTEIAVVDPDEFDQDGGYITLVDVDGNSETVSYVVSGEGQETLIPGAALSGTYVQGDMVYMTDASGTRIIERWADIIEMEGEEVIRCRIPHSLYGLLKQGVRQQDNGEMVLFGEEGTDAVVMDVLGRSPIRDLNSELITTSPDGMDPQTWMDEDGLNMSMESTSGAPVESVKWWNGGTVKAYVQPIFNVAGLSSVQFLLWDEARVGYAFLELKTPNNNTPTSAYEIRAAVQADGGSVESVGLINGAGGSDFELATSAGWQDWTPTFSGWSANPSGGIYRYKQTGKTVHVAIAQPNNGTSNATSKSISAPVTAKTISGMNWAAPCQVVDSGTVQTTPGQAAIASGGSTINFYKDYALGSWTASGNQRIATCHLTYEAA